MIIKPIFSLLLSLCCGVSFAQFGGPVEKSALKNIDKHRWQKAEAKLRKSLSRDTLSPSLRLALSTYYFHPENPDFQLDSAYRYAVGALEDYTLTPPRERERLRRLGVDSLRLTALRAKIDSAAFEVARRTNTEASYLEFLSHFPTATQRQLATQLRDEVAFQDALRQNSHEAFHRFLTQYPNAQRAPEARALYDRLLYQEATSDQRLASFERFLADHPETPYRREIYRNIFEISTADGTVTSFESFMARYPVSHLVGKARQIIFHLLADEEDSAWSELTLDDSLQNLLDINKTYLIPFLKNNRYGFMDDRGYEVIPPLYTTVHADYLCGNVTDELLIVDNRLIARNGSVIYHGPISAYSDLGIGFLKIETPYGTSVIHKAGFVFADSVEDARVLSKAFIAIRKPDGWYVYTLTGRLLDDRAWEDVTSLQDVIVFSGNKHKFIARKKDLGMSADGNPLPLSEPFDEVKLWSNGYIWGKAGQFEGVLDQSLHRVIAFDNQQLTQTPFGAVAVLPNGFVIYNWTGKRSRRFDEVNVMGKTVGVRDNNSWFVYDPVDQQVASKHYDLLKAEGPFVVGRRADSVFVHSQNHSLLVFFQPQVISFIPGLDSTSFLAVQDKSGEKTVFDLNGKKLFSAFFDAIEYAGQGIFVITRKDKKGLVDFRGSSLLPVEFDAIGSAKDQVISLLKSKKFGAYNIKTRKFIRPQFDRNVLAYASSFLITFKDGSYGFLGWNGKAVSAFEFEEINYWNDSLALVKKAGLWNLYDLTLHKIIERNMSSVSLIKDESGEKIAIIQKESNYGVINNHGRILIPATFSDIINLGSSERPLYFTEKHIAEASLYIVIYYDETGDMLRKEIYDDAADYDKIYCAD